MVGKNNIDALNRKAANKVNRYGIRRLSVGVASVAVAGLLFMSNTVLAEAAEVTEGDARVESVSNADPEVPLADDQAEMTPVTNEASVEANQDAEESAAEVNQDAEESAAASDQTVDNEVSETSQTEAFQLSAAQVQQLQSAGLTNEEINNVVATIQAQVAQNPNFDVDAHINSVIQTKLTSVKQTAEAEDRVADTPADQKALNDDQAGKEDEKSLTDFKAKKNQKGEEYYEDQKTKKEFFKKPNWEEKEAKNEGLTKWELHPDQRLRSVNNMSEAQQLGQLNYVGNHKVEDDKDSYTVLDFTYTWAQRADSGVWKNVNLFMSKELEKAVDWTRSGYYYNFGTGSEKFYKFENGKVSNEKIMYFNQMVQAAQAGNVHHTPLRFYLKNKTMADIDNIDTTLQSRVTNSDNTQVMTTQFGKDNNSNLYMDGYGAYTNATAIPKSNKSNGRSKTNPLLRQYASPGVDSTSPFIGSRNFSSYNSDEEKLYIASQWRKDDTNSSNSKINNKSFAYRFAFSKDILDTLQEDKDGYVGYIEPSKTAGNYKAINPSGSRTGFTRDQINIDEETGQAYLLFAPQEYKTKHKNNGKPEQVVTVQNGTMGFADNFSTLLADQQYTVTTLNVDSQKLKERYNSIQDGSKRNMIGLDVYTSIVADNSEGNEFVRTKTTEKVSAKKGDKVTVKFKASPWAKTETKGSEFIGMRIGKYQVFGDLSVYSRRGTPSRYSYSNFSYNNKPWDTYTFTLPEDVTFDKDSLVELFANYGGNLIENSADIFINGKKVASFNNGDAKKTHKALTVEGTQSNSSTLLDNTQYRPAIKDVYDTDKEIKGYTIQPDQLVELHYGDAATKTRKSSKTLSSDTNTPGASYSYDGKDYPDQRGLYEYTAKIEEGTKLVKDAPIVARSYNYQNSKEIDTKDAITDGSVNKSAVGSDSVIGKVRARVTFDKNYEGGGVLTTVDAPENKKFATDPGYKANGLNYNGINAMPTETPTREGYVFKGWSTNKDSQVADFDGNTAIINSMTVYAVWSKAGTGDTIEPKYGLTNGEVDKEVTTEAPTFTKQDSDEAATAPAGTKYKLVGNIPEGATIDEDTGKITYTPKLKDAGESVEFDVQVTYPDQSTDGAKAIINVGKKDDNEKYEPEAGSITTDINKVPNPADGIKNKNDLPEDTQYEWSKEPKVDEAGKTKGTVKVTYPDKTTDEVEVEVTVEDNRKDNEKYPANPPQITWVDDLNKLTQDEKNEVKGKVENVNPKANKVEVDQYGNVILTYPDGTTNNLSRYQTVKEKEKTDAQKNNPVPVSTPLVTEVGTVPNAADGIENLAKLENVEKVVWHTVPDVSKVADKVMGTALVVYKDGSTDKVEVPVKVVDKKDTTAPKINRIGDQTVVEGNPIKEVEVKTDDPNAKISIEGQPDGVEIKEGKISGTPEVKDWGKDEEERDFTVKVTAEDEAGNKSETEFNIKVQRDTDKDGIPDIHDKDDDGDGVPDDVEKEKGTDPKDPNSKPNADPEKDTTAPKINRIGDQTVVEGNPIKDVEVTTDDPNAKISIEGQPDGVEIKEGKISGTP
ncbi:Rib/alpha-like domain-containing protein, partial [Facklamia hominis]